MPSRSSEEDLRERIGRLQSQQDNNATQINEVHRDVATCEAILNTHTQDLEKIDKRLDDIQNLTSETRTVTWKHIGIIAAIFSVLTLPLLGFSAAAISAWYLPQRIERVSIDSESVNNHLSKVISKSLEDRLKPTNETLQNINKTTEEIRYELNAIRSAVKTTVNRREVVQSLRHHTSKRRTSKDNLSEVRNLLSAIRDLRVPLERQDYKDLSIRLYTQFINASDPEEKNALLTTIIQAANAKSVSEPTLHTVPEAVFEEAKKSNNYFEGTVDLSSRAEWKGAVFNKCKLEVSKPDVPIVLTDVRFLECNFDSLPQNIAMGNFLSEYLESTRQTVSYPGYKVIVNYGGSKPVAKLN